MRVANFGLRGAGWAVRLLISIRKCRDLWAKLEFQADPFFFRPYGTFFISWYFFYRTFVPDGTGSELTELELLNLNWTPRPSSFISSLARIYPFTTFFPTNIWSLAGLVQILEINILASMVSSTDQISEFRTPDSELENFSLSLFLSLRDFFHFMIFFLPNFPPWRDWLRIDWTPRPSSFISSLAGIYPFTIFFPTNIRSLAELAQILKTNILTSMVSSTEQISEFRTPDSELENSWPSLFLSSLRDYFHFAKFILPSFRP